MYALVVVAKRKRAYRNLGEFFQQTGTKQEELAERLGVTPSYVSMIAAGRRRPSLSLALRIVEIAPVPLETLLAGRAVA